MNQLRATIDALGVDAKVLLLRAQHEDMKEHVRIVQRDLAEALTLLDQHNTFPVPDLLIEVVDGAVKLAALRLQMVELALRDKGPNASDMN